MSVRVIVQPPAKSLISKSLEVEEKDAKLAELLIDLNDTLKAQVNPKGVGLSAPQLGVNKRIFVARPSIDKAPVIMINPVIVKFSELKTSSKDNRNQLEGCLSIPDIYGEVARSRYVEAEYWTVKWSDVRKGNIKLTKDKSVFEGFIGRVFQHEYDHLEGILFTMRVLEQGGKMYKLENEGKEEVLVQINW